MLFRLILLLAIVSGLVLFIWSNLQPLTLIFLGVQMPAFPLAFWVLGAIGAGVLTTLLINILYSLAHYAAGRAVRSQFRKNERRNRFQAFQRNPFQPNPSPPSSRSTTSKDDDAVWKNWEGFEESADRKRAEQPSTASKASVDDWEAETSDDWDAVTTGDMPRSPQDSTRDRPRADSSRPRTNYEASQESKTASRSGSVYSYGYRDPDGTGVGKAEPVTDKPLVYADYRVIVPPYRSLDEEQPPTPAPAPQEEEENADDWFEEDTNQSKTDEG